MLTRPRSFVVSALPMQRLPDFFGKDVRTINRWKIDHPDFCQALKDGKLVSDMEVADRLHERAVGFEYEEAQAHKLKTVQGSTAFFVNGPSGNVTHTLKACF
jgi:hypothetical protein